MVHNFCNFSCMHTPKRSSNNSEILGKNTYRFSIKSAGTCNYTIAMKFFFIHAKIACIMPNKHIILMERV